MVCRNWGRSGLHYAASLIFAGVAKLADALDLGSSGVIPVEVRVLSPAFDLNFDRYLEAPAIGVGAFVV